MSTEVWHTSRIAITLISLGIWLAGRMFSLVSYIIRYTYIYYHCTWYWKARLGITLSPGHSQFSVLHTACNIGVAWARLGIAIIIYIHKPGRVWPESQGTQVLDVCTRPFLLPLKGPGYEATLVYVHRVKIFGYRLSYIYVYTIHLGVYAQLLHIYCIAGNFGEH